MGKRSRFVKINIFLFILIGLTGCASNIIHRNQRALSHRELAMAPAPETQLLKKLMWPVTHHKITQDFREYGHGHTHDGIDISAPNGTRIYAPAEGHVVYAGQQFQGYGKMIIIEHTNKIATIYGHCQKTLVKTGEIVHRGTLIGFVGHTGRATASHLHFEVRVARQPVNPLRYLP